MTLPQETSPSPFELVTLKSGIKSLRLIENREIFHPGIGPEAEAKILHVEQQNLVNRCAQHGDNKFIIWDVGLGAAANAITAIKTLSMNLDKISCPIEIHSFDQTKLPAEFALNHATDLQYLVGYEKAIADLLSNGATTVNSRIKWQLHLGDFRVKMLNDTIPSPHSIFYDPYSPRENGEMWMLQHFTLLKNRLDPKVPCLMTNYSRSTVVRVTWLLAGFFVGIGTTIGQKEETSLASNDLKLLKQPLEQTWLKRVRISHSSAPIIKEKHELSPINSKDLEILLQHPQFNLTGTKS